MRKEEAEGGDHNIKKLVEIEVFLRRDLIDMGFDSDQIETMLSRAKMGEDYSEGVRSGKKLLLKDLEEVSE